MTEAEELLARLEEPNWMVHDKIRGIIPDTTAHEAAALIRRLLGEITGHGECICAKCGIRHGGSSYSKGDF